MGAGRDCPLPGDGRHGKAPQGQPTVKTNQSPTPSDLAEIAQLTKDLADHLRDLLVTETYENMAACFGRHSTPVSEINAVRDRIRPRGERLETNGWSVFVSDLLIRLQNTVESITNTFFESVEGTGTSSIWHERRRDVLVSPDGSCVPLSHPIRPKLNDVEQIKLLADKLHSHRVRTLNGWIIIDQMDFIADLARTQNQKN